MPEAKDWSISSPFRAAWCWRNMTAKRSQLIMSSIGSKPRWASSGTARRMAAPSPVTPAGAAATGAGAPSPATGATETNISPKVRGST